MNLIENACLDLYNAISTNKSKDDILTDCVLDKLNALYCTQTKDFDELIDSLSICLSDDNIEYLSKVIKKLSKIMNGNRARLLKVIEEAQE